MNEPLPPRKVTKGDLCSVEGCSKFVRVRGLCTNHYERERLRGIYSTETNPKALVKLCPNHGDEKVPAKVRGLCKSCYNYWYHLRKHGQHKREPKNGPRVT